MTSILRHVAEAEAFPPARQGTILNSHRVIGKYIKALPPIGYLNGAKLGLSDLHNDDSRFRTAGCSLTSYRPGPIVLTDSLLREERIFKLIKMYTMRKKSYVL